MTDPCSPCTVYFIKEIPLNPIKFHVGPIVIRFHGPRDPRDRQDQDPSLPAYLAPGCLRPARRGGRVARVDARAEGWDGEKPNRAPRILILSGFKYVFQPYLG